MTGNTRADGKIEIITGPGGLVVGWAGAGLVGVGVVLLSAPVGIVGFCLLGCWGLGRWLARRRLAGVRILRPTPKRAWAGRSFAVAAQVDWNRGDFGKSRGDEAEEGRLPAWWSFRLTLPSAPFELRDPLAVSRSAKLVEPDAEGRAAFSYPAKCRRRGLHRFDDWTAVSTWPLGWFRARRRGAFHAPDESDVTVWPAPWLPGALEHRVDVLVGAAALAASGTADPAAEFRLLREFRPGDPVSGVHWPASFRCDRLLVREPDPPAPRPRRYGVVMHAYCPAGRLVTPERFEIVLRMAAGLLLRLRRAGAEVVWQLLPDAPATLRSSGDDTEALDALALARRRPFASAAILTRAVGALPRCEEIFVLGEADRSSWSEAISSDRVRVLCIDPDSFSPSPVAPRLRSAS